MTSSQTSPETPDEAQAASSFAAPYEPASAGEPEAGGRALPVASDVQTGREAAGARTSCLGAVGEVLETLILALVIFLLIRNVVQNFRIEGPSMQPNFHDGQFLFINRFAYCPGLHLDAPPVNLHWSKTWCLWPPQRGDVIVFRYPRDPTKDFIKRVIGLPGETVEVRSGRVYIDGELLPEPFGPLEGSYSAPPIVVPKDNVYVMGDNRNNSSDSHTWGPLPESFIVGRALLSYWPPQDWGIVPQWNYSQFEPTG
jgi:signal peptidase I